ncbi:TPA: hypothetical protein ACH3X3_001971 [Trebouxia sp. C0006]
MACYFLHASKKSQHAIWTDRTAQSSTVNKLCCPVCDICCCQFSITSKAPDQPRQSIMCNNRSMFQHLQQRTTVASFATPRQSLAVGLTVFRKNMLHKGSVQASSAATSSVAASASYCAS